jgi:hypothetical protein
VWENVDSTIFKKKNLTVFKGSVLVNPKKYRYDPENKRFTYFEDKMNLSKLEKDARDYMSGGIVANNLNKRPFNSIWRDYSGDFDTTGTFFNYLYSTKDESLPEGQVRFDPAFQKSAMTNGNYMLFTGGTLVDQDRYNIIGDGLIEFTDPEDRPKVAAKKYTMVVYSKESSCQVIKLTADVDEQQIWENVDIPDLDSNTFTVFRGSVILNPSKYKYEKDTKRFILYEEPLDLGRSLSILVFYAHSDDEVIKKKMISHYFKVETDLSLGRKKPRIV